MDRHSSLNTMIQLTTNYTTIKGFTLLELMTVIAILGIVASLTIPLFTSQNLKKNRVIAISSLLYSRSLLEKCFLNNQPNNYNACKLDSSDTVDIKNRYKITPEYNLDSNNNRISYTLTATSLNTDSSKVDTDCISFSITNIGIKTSTGTGSLNRCWTQ